MAELFLHNSMTVEAGKTIFMHDSLSLTVAEELEDINNDFRMRRITPYDINNDFRSVLENYKNIDNDFRLVKLNIQDISNDFRIYGELVRVDIDNDFRFADYADININNDFRMVGEPTISDINNDFRDRVLVYEDINNKFDTVKLELEDVNNKVNTSIETDYDTSNILAYVAQIMQDVSNDFRTKKDTITNINNDFRMLSPWQVPEAGEPGFQSSGKGYVQIFINGGEQIDADINTLSISQILNGPHTVSFDLGRPYDDTKPATNSIVEIKYNGILLYKGYITEVAPTDSPESIRINCQDEYWNLNKDKKYFFVGRKPADAKEFYYDTIKEGLNDLGFSYDIGNFIPQTMNLYNSGTANAISRLVQNSGNFSWFIKPDGTKVLWEADRGNIIDLEPQELGKNLGLYQVLRHIIRENIDRIINKLRVLMGNWTVRKSSGDTSKGSGYLTYTTIQPISYIEYAIPAWDRSLEILAKNSPTGYGYDYQDPEKDYSEVYRKFWIPGFETGWTVVGDHTESLTDICPPLVEIIWGGMGGIEAGYGAEHKFQVDGFTIDYGFKQPYEYPIGARGTDVGRPFIMLSKPQYNIHYTVFPFTEPTIIHPKVIKLYLWKEFRFTLTGSSQSSSDEEPTESADNPLMFYTDKIGDYPETIIEDLNLSNLSVQEGLIVKDNDGNIIENIPSWDDTDFAKDYANWQLSNTYDRKYSGSIDLTIDSMIYYNIDLAKRIKIDGITSPINIVSITYNFNSFTAIINIESKTYYKRIESIPYHGE